MRRCLIGLLCCSASLFSQAQSLDCNTHHCMAVVDAGSTGSRLRIYHYDSNDSGMPSHIQEQWSISISPGLAALPADAVPAYLDGFLKSLPDVELPVYFYATAGMRLLNQVQQNTLYQAVNTWFSTHPHLHLKSARTISGHEEGVYGWAATNYQLGRMETNDKPLVGVMDMGGASVEISFPVSHPEALPSADLETIQLGDKQITLFTHSFLGLGQTEVTHQLLDAKACYSRGYVLSNQEIGSGQVDVCERKVDMLIRLHEVAQTLRQAIQDNPTQQWFVSGGLAMFAQKEPLHFRQAHFTPDELLHDADLAFCQANWSELYSRYSNDSYLITRCLSTAYYHALLVHGYGISPQQEVEFSAENSVGDWPLGVVLLQR